MDNQSEGLVKSRNHLFLGVSVEWNAAGQPAGQVLCVRL